jgi:UDP-N-acetylglucosamine:LPS N-acetylglucosamine transferase
VLPAFVNKAFGGEPLTLSGDGSQSRRFVYVEDLADGVVAGLADVARNRVYNLVSDEDVTIRDIAELVQEFVGNTEIVFTPARPGDLGSKLVSGKRAESELGWTAATPYREGVRRYIDWRIAQRALQEAVSAVPSRELARADAAEVAAALPHPEETGAVPVDPRNAGKVLIITADIGAGHDLPALAVAREFREENPDVQVAIVNGLPAMGPVMTHVLRENSEFMFRWVPWLFDLQYRLFMNVGPTRWLARRLLTFFGRRGLMRMIRAYEPDVIVSTYPGVTAILGELRQRGLLKTPCYSSITDLAGLQYWAHPGIDMHFITHPESAEEVERIAGPGSVRWAKPPTNPAFLQPRDRAQARRALELPSEGTVIAVSGGGWGVGDLIGAARAALEIEDATVLCLCGHNERVKADLMAQLGGDPRLRVMGFTNRMGDVLAAADVLVHSSVGLTVLEALIRGCPVISYGFGYGHVRESNKALERFGLAQVARKPEELQAALGRALASRPDPDGSFATRPGTAELVLANTRRVKSLPAWRVRTVRAATAGATTFCVAWVALSASLAYSFVSDLGKTALTAVNTPRAEVGLMVDAAPAQVPVLARALNAAGLHASFALQRPSDKALDAAWSHGDGALPRLSDGGLVSWFSTHHQLRVLCHEVGEGSHFLYASSGSNVGQWLFAHFGGGKLVAGAVTLQGKDARIGSLHAGQVIELRVTSLRSALAQVQRLSLDLQDRHLQAVRLGELFRDSGTPV